MIQFDQKEREKIQSRGKKYPRIVQKLKDEVQEVMDGELLVPETGIANWSLYYYCPDCSVKLTLDRKSPRKHICPCCKKAVSGEPYHGSWPSANTWTNYHTEPGKPGHTVLRGKDGRYLLLKHDRYGGEHDHYDRLGISYLAYGCPLSADLGTTGYGAKMHYDYYKNTGTHNTLVIGEENQAPVDGRLTRYEECQAVMRKREYLVCVDSDGCAMDTMNSKHIHCFGPAMIEVWGMEERQEEMQNCWNQVNLFSETRGINRFLALAIVLEKKGNKSDLDGFAEFKQWTEETKELSAVSLKNWIEQEAEKEKRNINFCQKAYQWTLLVNEKIHQLPAEGNRAFCKVAETLQEIHQKADIAVVSSANKAAVKTEWEREGLLKYVDFLMTQEEGSKAVCIRKLLEQGYPKHRVLMVGDAPGDLKAAEENGILYYPILANHETESWNRLCNQVFTLFLEGQYR